MYKIISPASSANMGPGFDCLGVCLSMSNSMVFSEFDDAVVINNHADTMRNRKNLIIESLFAACEIIGIRMKGVKLDVKTEIPLSRGLGSSASCISSGVAAAFMFAGMPLNKEEIFEIAVQLEGHADNVAPNLFGGLTLSYDVDGKYKCERYQIHEKYQFLACIPDFKLSTRKAREVLPEQYDREDIVFNLSRIGLLLGALQNGDNEAVMIGLQDKLHQPYRYPLVKDRETIEDICKKSGALGTYLSGAGPTIMSVVDDKDIVKKVSHGIRDAGLNWQVELLNVNYQGLECYRLK